MTGSGKYFFNSEDNKIYTGQFFNGNMYGNGIIETTNYIYRGEVKDGFFDGFGRYEDLKTHMVYEGSFIQDKKDGFGQEYSSIDQNKEQDGQKVEFEGFWKNDMKNGKGKMIFKNYLTDEICITESIWKNGIVL